MQLSLTPIGLFSTVKKMRYQTPLQPGIDPTTAGVITLEPGYNFEQALDGLLGFDRIWLLFWFHENSSWRPKVPPPRYSKKVGVFATRSPHRPNPIGLSSVRLEKISGRDIFITDHDLLDGTPILDIKPYIVYADAHTDTTQGWLSDVQQEVSFEMSAEFTRRCSWILDHVHIDLANEVMPLLRKKATPGPSNRIRLIAENRYLLAFKSWRVEFLYYPEFKKIVLVTITSGYARDVDVMQQGEDFLIHQAFMSDFT
jgi:tRNA-Thr(GGU) m(6)t(6)A37 methyltransferase TsaA